MPLKIDSIRLDQLTADPSSPVDGEIWYNVTEDVAKRRENGVTLLLFPPWSTAKDDSAATTTSATFVEKLNLNVTGIIAGTYILHYQFIVSGTTPSTEIEVRVQRDNTTDSFIAAWLPGAGDENAGSGIDFFTLSGGTHNFDVDFRRPSGTGDAGIKQVRLALQRIL